MSNAAVTAPGNRNAFPRPQKRTTPSGVSGRVTVNNNYVDTNKQTSHKKTQKDKKISTPKKKLEISDGESWIQHAQQVMSSAVNKLHSGRETTTPKALENKDTKEALRRDSEDKQELRDENVLLKKRDEELEAEIVKVVTEFDVLSAENERLRQQLDISSKPRSETYSRVFEDRDILREAEVVYKRRITRLEQELIESNERNEKLADELKSSKEKFQKLKEQNNKGAITKLNSEKKTLETEVEKLTTKIKQLEEHKCSPEQKTEPKKKAINRAYRNQMVKVSLKPNKVQDSYREQFIQRNARFEYEYRLPDSNIDEW